MNCALFNERLGALLAGTLSPEEMARAAAHAAGCSRCGEVLARRAEAAGADRPFGRQRQHGGEVRARRAEAVGRRPAEVPHGLAEGILARTSGPPCERARARLGDLVDGGAGVPAVERRGLLEAWLGAKRRREATIGGLDRVERQLVEAHLRHCPDCAALAAAASRLGDDLPALVPPAPPEFADAVLARTCRRPDPRTAVRRRGQKTAGRFWARPCIAWEAGCVAALAIWLACGASWSPLRTTAVEARVLLQQGVSGAGRAGAESAASVNRAVAAVSEQTVRAATQGVQDVAGQFARGWRRAAAAAPQLDRHWRQLVQALEDRDLFDGVAALRSLSRDAGAMLAELFSPSSSDTAEDAGPRPAARSRP